MTLSNASAVIWFRLTLILKRVGSVFDYLSPSYCDRTLQGKNTFISGRDAQRHARSRKRL